MYWTQVSENRSSFFIMAALFSMPFQFTVTIIAQTRKFLPLTVRAIFPMFQRKAVKKRRARCAVFSRAMMDQVTNDEHQFHDKSSGESASKRRMASFCRRICFHNSAGSG